jgi:rhodanese-related sulfurtransferase
MGVIFFGAKIMTKFFELISVNNINTLSINEENATDMDPLAELKPFQLIDVRRPDEFNGELGHIPGAELVTLGEQLEKKLNVMDKKTKIIFICRSGARSGHATLMAQELGFDSVYNLEGGMIHWNNLDLPTVTN